MKIYTMGYTGRQMDDIVAMTYELDAVLIDCRYVPFSMFAGWRKHAFVSAFVEALDKRRAEAPESEQYSERFIQLRYRHCKGFGNENYKKPMEGVRLHNPSMHEGEVRQLLQGYSIILMCSCIEPTGCHRRHVAHWICETMNLPDSLIEHIPSPPPKSKKKLKLESGKITGANRGPMDPPSQKDLFGV